MRGFDTSHSRPHKATAPGTRPNDKSLRTKRKQLSHTHNLQVRHLERKMRRGRVPVEPS